jgi:hypothetical protein
MIKSPHTSNPPHVITVTGPHAPETAKIVRDRLEKVAKPVQEPVMVMDMESISDRLRDTRVFRVDVHDTPAFAAEKILDELAKSGWIALEEEFLTETEQEQIRKRLQGLGYIE